MKLSLKIMIPVITIPAVFLAIACSTNEQSNDNVVQLESVKINKTVNSTEITQTNFDSSLIKNLDGKATVSDEFKSIYNSTNYLWNSIINLSKDFDEIDNLNFKSDYEYFNEYIFIDELKNDWDTGSSEDVVYMDLEGDYYRKSYGYLQHKNLENFVLLFDDEKYLRYDNDGNEIPSRWWLNQNITDDEVPITEYYIQSISTTGFYDKNISKVDSYDAYVDIKNKIKAKPITKIEDKKVTTDFYDLFETYYYRKRPETIIKDGWYMELYADGTLVPVYPWDYKHTVNDNEKYKKLQTEKTDQYIKNNHFFQSKNYYKKISSFAQLYGILYASKMDENDRVKILNQYLPNYFIDNQLLFIPNYVSKVNNNKIWKPTTIDFKNGYSEVIFKQQELSANESELVKSKNQDTIMNTYFLEFKNSHKQFVGQTNFFFEYETD